jgi:MtrB/PioB family decaheme-associated outer membrane protein
MDTTHTRFTLRVGVGMIVSSLLLGQAAIAAEHVKHTTSKPTKTSKHHKHVSKSAKTAPVAKPVPAPIAVKPLVTPPAKEEEASVLSAEAREMTEQKSYIEAGVLGVTNGNWKFGQYNGITNSGAYGIGNFDLRGGGAYDSADATRWRVTGKNIGLESREFTGEFKDQGKYKLNFGYDEIYRNAQGSYQSPYIGAGGNELALPSFWKYPTTANNMRTLPATNYAGFEAMNLSTKRRRVDGGFSYFIDPQWELKASMRHEDKNGIQALGAPIVATRSVTLPNPISQSTDQINASINFAGEKAFGSFAYYGSIFHNDYNSVNFQNAYAAPVPGSQPYYGQMSTMPDNQFHQFTLSGGYNFSADTKLVGSGGYGRNWQDQSFLPYSTLTVGSPSQGNLNGAVDFKNVNVKLTNRTTKDLNLAAAYKYEERENLTSVNTYQFPDVDTAGPGANYRNNTPFSRRVQQGNLDADYSFIKGHWLKAGYEIQNIDRWCNGTWISCTDTPTTLENIGKLDYRGSFFDKVNARLGYAYSNRSAENYNQDSAYLASFRQPQTAADWNLFNQYLGAGLPAWGPFLGYAPRTGVAYPYPTVFVNNNAVSNLVTGGNNALDINGLGRYNTAPRDQQKFHSLLDYQVTDKLNVGVNGDYRYDNYYESSYGLQSSRNWSINLDTSYAFNEDISGHVFYTYQDIMSKTVGASYGANSNTGSSTAGSVIGGCYNNVLAVNNNAKTDPCRNWLSNMDNNIDTVGFGLKHKGFLSGKLDLASDFLYSFARTNVNVNGGVYTTSPTGTAANGPTYLLQAANEPEVKSQLFSLKFNAKYSISKSSAAHFTYLYQHLISNDYIYTGMSIAGTPTGVMPTNAQAPNYSVHAFGLSYIYSF